jgi:hypothetical protein
VRASAIALVLAACAAHADAKPAARAKPTPKHAAGSRHMVTVPDATSTPAYRDAQLTPAECTAQLDARQIAYDAEPSRGVLAAVRLRGPLHGVTFHADEPAAKRATSPYEIADCRLVLALDDFAQILASHGIVDVRHYSIYRPPPKSWADDKIGIQHHGALAIDAAAFTTADGTSLVVDRDFHGAIGAKTCGPDAHPRPATAAATELRAILCETVAAHLFNVILTPNHNRPHHNHFHLEVMAGVTWFLAD